MKSCTSPPGKGNITIIVDLHLMGVTNEWHQLEVIVTSKMKAKIEFVRRRSWESHPKF